MLSRIPLRTKLLLLIAIPLAALAVVAALQVTHQFERAARSESQIEEVDRVHRLGGIVQAIDTELLLAADPEITTEDIMAVRGGVDAAIDSFLADPDETPGEVIDVLIESQDRLTNAR